MKQFFTISDDAFRILEERAQSVCMRFREQDMPPGSVPATADIGFEVDQKTGAASLLVSKGVRYKGPSPTIRKWLDSGSREFSSFDSLREWIGGPLKEAFEMHPAVVADQTADGSGRLSSSELTDIPAVHGAIGQLDRPLFLDEGKLYEKLRERVLGQDDALKALASVMVRHCARLHPSRPAVVFAIGPSGVGKTRTAEVLTNGLPDLHAKDRGYQFLRLDMTEYQEAHRVSQLIGAPQGYAGHGQGSQLVDALRANPRTIVLFDEIEKAHSAILRVIMNAMDAGRLSTADRSENGREIDCRYAVFMFTSNLNAEDTLNEMEARQAYGDLAVEDEICRRRLHAAGIAPEIVGRIGRFLVYRPLQTATRAEILALSIAEVAEEYGLQVRYIEPDVVISLMDKLLSQNFGARPARYFIDDALGLAFARAVQDKVANPVQVLGPPFRCVAQIQAAKSSG